MRLFYRSLPNNVFFPCAYLEVILCDAKIHLGIRAGAGLGGDGVVRVEKEAELLEKAFELFEGGLSNNDSYWEAYWLTAEEALRLAYK